MITLNEARDISYGPSLVVIEYPSTDVFSIASIVFKTKGSDPTTYLAWLLSQEETHRYMVSISDFWLIYSEVQHLLTSDEQETSIDTSIFDSMILKSPTIEEIDDTCEVVICTSAADVSITFKTRYSIDTYSFKDVRLFTRFLDAVYRSWVDYVPFFVISHKHRAIVRAQTVDIFEKDKEEYMCSITMKELDSIREQYYTKLNELTLEFDIITPKVRVESTFDSFKVYFENELIEISMPKFEAFLDYCIRRQIPVTTANFAQFHYKKEKKFKDALKKEKKERLIGAKNGTKRSSTDIS